VQLAFGDYVLDGGRRELRRGSEQIALEPQVFDVLLHLVQNRDRVVTKTDLIAAVWDGRIVSDSTLTSRIYAARKAVGDSGEQQRFIRTFARKGFRFVSEVQETTGFLEPERRPPSALSPPPETRGKPCVAVPPFVNLSDDPGQEYFSDGITEDIITALSKHRSLLTIARNAIFAFKGHDGDMHRIRPDLGANYIVQGSVRRIGQRVRITVQLVETEGGRTRSQPPLLPGWSPRSGTRNELAWIESLRRHSTHGTSFALAPSTSTNRQRMITAKRNGCSVALSTSIPPWPRHMDFSRIRSFSA
jgi:TolB-like protein